jgi:hypothetical protein
VLTVRSSSCSKSRPPAGVFMTNLLSAGPSGSQRQL